mgnify:CR=1 FL=1|jgi:G:T-mismatch repair DNA endonuclease (very short patch repair protein)|tara:strand:+ start:261 stop:626 length:366 start_codon:yes stop_codon:yes gene_type:complete
MKNLIAQTYHFQKTYKNNMIWNEFKKGYIGDVEEIEQTIRIFGTKEQVQEAALQYIKEHNLILDEVYDYKVEVKGSYWYEHPCYKGDFHKEMKQIKDKLKEYLYLYKKKNEALIINLKLKK